MTAQPGTLGVGHVLIASNIGEVLITVGQTRVSIADGEPGRVNVSAGVEWLHTVSMSPQVAHQVMMRLSSVLSEYTRKYGRIPEDPAFNALEAPSVN